MKILVMNGPNLNRLGTREVSLYGHERLEDIEKHLQAIAEKAGATIRFFQSNSEAALIECIHTAGDEQIDFIVINPAAFTHTSIALRDAFLAVGIPFIEVHLSNTQARESFRRHSYLADIAVGSIVGLGARGYEYALSFGLTQRK